MPIQPHCRIGLRNAAVRLNRHEFEISREDRFFPMHWLFLTEGVSRWIPAHWRGSTFVCWRGPTFACWLASLLPCMAQGQVPAAAPDGVASAQLADEGVWFAGWDALGPWGAGAFVVFLLVCSVLYIRMRCKAQRLTQSLKQIGRASCRERV